MAIGNFIKLYIHISITYCMYKYSTIQVNNSIIVFIWYHKTHKYNKLIGSVSSVFSDLNYIKSTVCQSIYAIYMLHICTAHIMYRTCKYVLVWSDILNPVSKSVSGYEYIPIIYCRCIQLKCTVSTCTRIQRIHSRIVRIMNNRYLGKVFII